MADKDDEIRELKERLAKLEGGANAPVPPPVAPPQPNGCGTAVGIVAVLLVVLFIIGMCSSDDGAETYSANTSSWTPPPGFLVEPNARGGAIATQWEKPTRAECRGSGVTCFALNVVTERDCPRNLYASITLFDTAGQNIGWTNDTAQGVQAGERTRLVFDTYERGVESARVAELNCY